MVEFQVKNLSFTYNGAKKAALSNVSFEIDGGQLAVICGKSASGKSTLLSLLKPEPFSVGTLEGGVTLCGALKDCRPADIGFIFQNLQFQTVCHTVRGELLFSAGLCGLSQRQQELRVAETAAYFSIEGLLDRKISELSGGQLQLVCLAAQAVMHPKALLLDEPLSLLDPTAAQRLVSILLSLCRDEGVTVVVCEHRLEQLVGVCDKLLVLDEGKLIYSGAPAGLTADVIGASEYLSQCLPAAMRLYAASGVAGPPPLTVGRARESLISKFKNERVQKRTERPKGGEYLEIKNLCFSYDSRSLVLDDLSLKVRRGSVHALFGANAAGKSTLLRAVCGALAPKYGKISFDGERYTPKKPMLSQRGLISLVPQFPRLLFACDTVYGDLMAACRKHGRGEEELDRLCRELDIDGILSGHPYDVSAGELERAAICMALVGEPKILLLDEPTRGLDEISKRKLGKILRRLACGGVTVLLASHDCEFCAEYCDDCSFLSNGKITVTSPSDEFFLDNYFFTTQVCKIFRNSGCNFVTDSQVLECLSQK